jgi:uncharacterized membrane protein (DUF485 family)
MTHPSDQVDHHDPAGISDHVRVVHASPEFTELRRRSRAFTFAVGAFVLAWFLLLLWTVGFQPALMATDLGGHITVGLLFAWSQVITTLAVAALFVRHTRTNRALVETLRARLDEGAGR